MDRAEIERKIMSETVVEKTREIPAHGGKKPVTITLRIPEVTVTDSQGRHIVISPEQAEPVRAKMDYVADWIDDCDARPMRCATKLFGFPEVGWHFWSLDAQRGKSLLVRTTQAAGVVTTKSTTTVGKGN
ncbi:MAG: hypothetical protein ACRDTA_30210 [Pseudonocardiaceae bacterium]